MDCYTKDYIMRLLIRVFIESGLIIMFYFLHKWNKQKEDQINTDKGQVNLVEMASNFG